MGAQRQAARAEVPALTVVLAFLPLAESLRILLYVPLHVSELGTGAFNEFADCTLKHAPFVDEESESHVVDMLVLVNGKKDDILYTNLKGLRAAVETRVAASSYLRSGMVDALALSADQYDRRRTTDDWTDGPNLVFYSVMAEGGGVYEQYTRNYDFVQQLEPDCCALAPGWLGAALVPMSSAPGASGVMLSGSSIKGNKCMYNDTSGLCETSDTHPRFIREHINGNAAYRIGPGLQRLMDLARGEYEHWPFDLALWLAAQDLGLGSALADCPAVLNVPHPVDKVTFLDPRYWPGGGKVKLVHVPQRFRKGPYDAVAPFLDPALPATLSFVSDSHRIFAHNLLSSLERLDSNGIANVIVFSFSHSTYFELLDRFRGVAVVARTELGLDIRGSTVWKSRDYLKVVDHKIVVVMEMLSRRFSAFVLDADCYVFADYLPLLTSLPKDTLYFSSEAFSAHGYLEWNKTARYLLNAGVFYMPWGERVMQFVEHWRSIITEVKDEQEALNELFACTAMEVPEDCEWRGLPVRLLPPEDFLNGNNYFTRQWPSPEQTRRALVVHNNWADGYQTKRFRYQFRNIWHGTRHLGCHNVSAVSVGPMELSGATAANVISAYLSFFTFLRKHRVNCAILPGFAVHADEAYTLPFDSVFRYNEVAAYTGTLFFPSEQWLTGDPPPRLRFHHAAHLHYDVALLEQDYYEFHIFSFVLETYVRYMLPTNFVCAVDSDRSASEVSLRVLRGQLPALVQQLDGLLDSLPDDSDGNSYDHTDGEPKEGTQPRKVVYLTGKWRMFAANITHLSGGKVVTSGEAFFPRHLSRRFGIPYAFDGRLDLDPFTDVLDWLLCRKASAYFRVKSFGPNWKRLPRKAVLVELLKHVPPAVFEEDLGIMHRMPNLLSNLHKRRLVVPLESVEDNDISEVEASLQSLLYFSKLAGSSAIMPSLSSSRTVYQPAPWSDVVDIDRLYSTFPNLLPHTMLVVLRPTAVLDWMQGRQVALTWQQHEANLGTMTRYRHVLLHMLRMTSHAWPRTWHIVDNAEEHKRNGSFATKPGHPYLGLTDAEALQGMSQFPDDINFPRASHTLKFDTASPTHRQFAAIWRLGYAYSHVVIAAAAARIASLGRPFGCLHLQLHEEGGWDDDAREGGKSGKPPRSTNDTAMLSLATDAARELLASGASVYVITDCDMFRWAAGLTSQAALHSSPLSTDAGAATPVVLANGCEDGLPRTVCMAADKVACAAADSFAGNTHSALTLGICGLRNDQECEDLRGRAVRDGRFLF